MDIVFLCKVVDNFGDIGFVYRLALSLKKIAFRENKSVNLFLVVSNLHSFNFIEPLVDPALSEQTVRGLKIIDWNNNELCRERFAFLRQEAHGKQNVPIILECFQCGRPVWLEEILFPQNYTQLNLNTVQIINVEYLTAEEWADDFHLLKSGTRDKNVKKINFFPGFTNKTAGLLLDSPFVECIKDKEVSLSLLQKESKLSKEFFSYLKNNDDFCILLFSYPRNFTDVVEAIKEFEAKKKKENKNFSVRVFVAGGVGKKSFIEECKKQDFPFSVYELPYLSQEKWDSLLTLTDANCIRGEDSFSRACLSGTPFLWHAYVQDEEFQLVKIDAFLKRLEPFFSKEDFLLLRKLYLKYNRTKEKTLGEEALGVCGDVLDVKCATDEPCNVKEEFLLFLNKNEVLREGFKKFSEFLFFNGDFAQHLWQYVNTLEYS